MEDSKQLFVMLVARSELAFRKCHISCMHSGLKLFLYLITVLPSVSIPSFLSFQAQMLILLVISFEEEYQYGHRYPFSHRTSNCSDVLSPLFLDTLQRQLPPPFYPKILLQNTQLGPVPSCQDVFPSFLSAL